MNWRRTLDEEIEALAFSPDSQYMVTAGEDAMLRLWNIENGTTLKEYAVDKPMDGIAWSHNGRTIAAGEEDSGNATLWRFGDDHSLEKIGNLHHGATVNSLVFTADDRHLVTAGDNGETIIWDLDNSSVLRELLRHEGPIKSVRLSPDGKYVATGGGEGDVKLWSFDSGELIHTMRHLGYVEAVEFTPDGRFLTTGGHDNYIRFWRVADFVSGLEPRAMLNVSNYGLAAQFKAYNTEYLYFHWNGELVSAHENGLVYLWLLNSDPTINRRVSRKLQERQRKAMEERLRQREN